MSFDNFNTNVIKSTGTGSAKKKKDEETSAPSGGFSNFSKAMDLEVAPVAKKPVEQVEKPREVDQFGLPKSYISKPTGNEVPYNEPAKKESIWTKAAKFVLPKKAEDFFGLNPSKAYTDTKTAYENAYAYTDLKNLEKKIDPTTGKLPKQTAGDKFKETPVDKYIPFVSSIKDITESVQLYQSAKRLEKGENTPVDDYRLAKFKAESERDKTFMAKVTSIITELPSFAGELALTGGIYTAAKVGTEKAIAKTLVTTAQKSAARNTVERILTKSIGNVVGGTAQVIPARFGQITAGTIQNMTPEYQYTKDEQNNFQAFITKEGDNPWLAAAKSFSDQWVEVVSEHSGGIFNEALSPLAKPLKNQLMKVAVFKSLLKSNPTLTSSKFMKLVDSAGWNGIFAEMGEERVGEAMRGLLTQVGLSEDGFRFPSKEQLAVELVAFSVPGAMVGLSNKMLQGENTEGSFKTTPVTTKEVDNSGNIVERDETGEVVRVVDQSGDIIQGEPETHDVATEAEQIIGARDMAAVGKGDSNLSTDAFAELQTKLDTYQKQMAQTIFNVVDTVENIRTSVAEIQTIQYPDGKFASKVNANTPNYAIATDFLQGRLYDTQADAVKEAKESLISWAKQTLDSGVEQEDADTLNTISEQADKINNESDIPVEVRRQVSASAEIATLEGKVLDIDNQIKEIDKTMPEVLAKFTKEYQDQLKNRKTMAEHMDEVKGLIADTKERTPEEIDALRNQKIQKLEAERAKFEEDAPIAYQGGSANASIGVYRDGTPIELGSLDSIRPMEMPELVRLARKLTGSAPKVKAKLRSKLGLFKPSTGETYLRADQFVQGNEEQLAKLLGHEIGHLGDWLPDRSENRGNLLGRVFSLNKFIASTFNKETGEALDLEAIRTQAFKQILVEKNVRYGDYLTKPEVRDELKPIIKARYNYLVNETGAIKNQTIKDELTNLSEYWRPYDILNSSESFKAYRNSPKELYADALSVLFNSPGTLEKMAPTFYKEFFAALDAKPDFKASYFELQELLNGSTEDIFKARKEDIRTGFAKAEAIQADFAEKKKAGTKAYWERLRQQLDDINYPINKKLKEAEAKGAVIEEKDNPKFILQEESYIDNENFLLIDDIDANVVKPIEKAGMIIDDLGEYLLLHRIQNDRADIANPFGFNVKNAGQQLDHLKETVGEENFALLQEKAQYFHDLVFKSVEEAVAVGSYNKETFETKIKPNKNSYASFQVVDYMQDYMPATIKAQVGTLKEVANPFVSTILKTVALNRLNAHQRAKNATIKLLTENFPEDITKTKRITTDGKLSIFKPAKDRGALQLLVDGKMESYDVDPYIAESFTHNKVGDMNILVSLLDKFNNKLFKPLVTTYNLGFAAAFNPIRDFKRNYKMIPNATVANLLTAYVKSLPSAVNYSRGKMDAFTKTLVESKAINAPINDYNFDPREDELGRILERYGLIKADDAPTNRSVRILRNTLLKPVTTVLESIRFVANTFEIVSKVAGAKVRIKGGEAGKELAYNLRNFTGTPNYKVKGLQTNTTNAIFVFSNIAKEGLKSDYRIATNPKTASGYWWKTVKIDVLPKLLMFLAGAGLLGDLLKEFFDDVSEYDKTNYLIIPLGWYESDKASFGMLGRGETDTVGRKAVYMRIPHDETGRLIASTFWKMANMVKNGGDTKSLQDIFSIGAGQLPSVTPAISVVTGWAQYLAGKNPYDTFRGRTVIDDTTFAAGGTASLKKMVQWTTNNIGLTKFATFDKSKQTGLESTIQVAPWFSSVFKISNYGQQEKLKAIGAEAKKEEAQKSLADRELIAKYVEQARADKSTLFAASKYRLDIIKESLGGRLPQNADEAKTADNLILKFKRSLKRGLNDDPRVDTILSATSNNQKKEIIKEITSGMSDTEFYDFKKGLLEDKIVTPEVMFGITNK